jgi:hypothetical protein
VGNDPRVSAPLLGPAVLSGLVSAGAQAVNVGLATTPAMFYGIVAPGGAWAGPAKAGFAHLVAGCSSCMDYCEGSQQLLHCDLVSSRLLCQLVSSRHNVMSARKHCRASCCVMAGHPQARPPPWLFATKTHQAGTRLW